jgi:hypothetical protein
LHRIRNVRVERHDVSQPDALESWRSGMPRPSTASPTIQEIRKTVDSRINTALAGLPRAVTPQATAMIIHEVRQQLRQEFAAEIEKLRAEVAEKLPREGGAAAVVEGRRDQVAGCTIGGKFGVAGSPPNHFLPADIATLAAYSRAVVGRACTTLARRLNIGPCGRVAVKSAEPARLSYYEKMSLERRDDEPH